MVTLEQVLEQRAAFERHGYSRFDCLVGGRQIQAFVLPYALGGELRNFAFQMVAPNVGVDRSPDSMLLGISEDVPVPFRQFAVLHEFFEYVEGMTCCEAAALELACARRELPTEGAFRKYVHCRTILFDRLPAYSVANGYPPAKVAEFERTASLFQVLSGVLSSS